jgi:hypothetical protein
VPLVSEEEFFEDTSGAAAFVLMCAPERGATPREAAQAFAAAAALVRRPAAPPPVPARLVDGCSRTGTACNRLLPPTLSLHSAVALILTGTSNIDRGWRTPVRHGATAGAAAAASH